MSTKPFTPSPYLLNVMIASAMAKCDADCEQAWLAEQARQDRRAERMEIARARSNEHNRTREFWR